MPTTHLSPPPIYPHTYINTTHTFTYIFNYLIKCNRVIFDGHEISVYQFINARTHTRVYDAHTYFVMSFSKKFCGSTLVDKIQKSLSYKKIFIFLFVCLFVYIINCGVPFPGEMRSAFFHACEGGTLSRCEKSKLYFTL